MKKFFSNKLVEYTTISIILLITLGCLFTPELDILIIGAEYTVHIMLGFLAAGMFFLVLGLRRLMFISLAASMILSLFLKEASNTQLLFPKKSNEPEIKIALINVLDAVDNIPAMIESAVNLDADILLFQEVTPEWNQLLTNYFEQRYPFHHIMLRIDPYGMVVYSKLPIVSIDTLYYQYIPNLKMTFEVNKEKSICIFSTYLVPPLYKNAGLDINEHLNTITEAIIECQYPIFSIGDFNKTYWSAEIRNYRKNANLENSRRDISPSSLRVPKEHIFYSNAFECTDFEEIWDEEQRHLGIFGTYQFKKLPSL